MRLLPPPRVFVCCLTIALCVMPLPRCGKGKTSSKLNSAIKASNQISITTAEFKASLPQLGQKGRGLIRLKEEVLLSELASNVQLANDALKTAAEELVTARNVDAVCKAVGPPFNSLTVRVLEFDVAGVSQLEQPQARTELRGMVNKLHSNLREIKAGISCGEDIIAAAEGCVPISPGCVKCPDGRIICIS